MRIVDGRRDLAGLVGFVRDDHRGMLGPADRSRGPVSNKPSPVARHTIAFDRCRATSAAPSLLNCTSESAFQASREWNAKSLQSRRPTGQTGSTGIRSRGANRHLALVHPGTACPCRPASYRTRPRFQPISLAELRPARRESTIFQQEISPFIGFCGRAESFHLLAETRRARMELLPP